MQMVFPTTMEGFEVKESNNLDITLSPPLHLLGEEVLEHGGKRGEAYLYGEVAEVSDRGSPSIALIDPMPPCMVFYQVCFSSLLRFQMPNLLPGASSPPLHPPGPPWKLASTSDQLDPSPSL